MKTQSLVSGILYGKELSEKIRSKRDAPKDIEFRDGENQLATPSDLEDFLAERSDLITKSKQKIAEIPTNLQANPRNRGRKFTNHETFDNSQSETEAILIRALRIEKIKADILSHVFANTSSQNKVLE